MTSTASSNKISNGFGGVRAYKLMLTDLNSHFLRRCSTPLVSGQSATQGQSLLIHREYDLWCVSKGLEAEAAETLWGLLSEHLKAHPYLQTSLLRNLFLDVPTAFRDATGRWVSPRRPAKV